MFLVNHNIQKIISKYEEYNLSQQLCTLIFNKCFSKKKSRATFSNTSDTTIFIDEILNTYKLKNIPFKYCEDNRKKYSFIILHEHLIGRVQTLTAFIFQIQESQNFANQTLYACLPLIELP